MQYGCDLLRLAWNEHKRRRIRGVLGSGGRPDELRRSHPHPGGQMKLVPGFHAVAEYERASGRQLRRVPRTAALRDRCFYRRARARRRARGEATPVPLSPCTRTPWHGRFHVACVCPFGSCATHLGAGRASHVDRAAAREVPTLHSCLSCVLAVSLRLFCPIARLPLQFLICATSNYPSTEESARKRLSRFSDVGPNAGGFTTQLCTTCAPVVNSGPTCSKKLSGAAREGFRASHTRHVHHWDPFKPDA